MKFFKKIISIILNIIFGLIIILAVFILFNVMNNKMPSIFGNSILRVVSGSMEPMLSVGDYILIKKTDTSELAVGDVISFYSNEPAIKGKLNTHQIVEIENNKIFITKGIANNAIDEYKVNTNEIVGKYITKLDFIKVLSPIINNKIVFLLVIIVPLCIIIFFEIKSLTKPKENKNEDS